MAERQAHGFDYQKRIIKDETLTEDVNYTGKWDAFSNQIIKSKDKISILFKRVVTKLGLV